MTTASPISLASLRRQLLPWGTGAALGACLGNALWLACMIYLQQQGDVAHQARAFPNLFRLNVGSALFITFCQVPIAATMILVALERAPARALIGGLFYALYIPVNLIAYYLYGRLAPLAHALPDSGAEAEVARTLGTFIEIGQPLALTGALPILGYGLLGLAWCLLAPAWWRRGGIGKAATVLLVTSGALSVAGMLGGYLDIGWLAAGCFAGGVVSLPALILLTLAFRALAERMRANES